MYSIWKSSLFLVGFVLLLSISVEGEEKFDIYNEFPPKKWNEKELKPIESGDFQHYWEVLVDKNSDGANNETFKAYLVFTTLNQPLPKTSEMIQFDIPKKGKFMKLLPDITSDRRCIMEIEKGHFFLYCNDTIFYRWVNRGKTHDIKHPFGRDGWLFSNKDEGLNWNNMSRLPAKAPSQIFIKDLAIKSLSEINDFEKTTLHNIQNNCFGSETLCTIDTENQNLIYQDKVETVYVGYKLKVRVGRLALNITMQPSPTTSQTLTKRLFYIMEDGVSGNDYYFPPTLKTFKEGSNTESLERYMLLPFINPNDKFMISRKTEEIKNFAPQLIQFKFFGIFIGFSLLLTYIF